MDINQNHTSETFLSVIKYRHPHYIILIGHDTLSSEVALLRKLL